MAQPGKYESVDAALAAASEALDFNAPAPGAATYLTSDESAAPGAEERARAMLADVYAKMAGDARQA